MAPFRLAKPRFVAYLALEGALVLALTWALANVTLAVRPDLPGQDTLLTVLAVAALFTTVLFVTQWNNPTDEASLTRELVLFTLLSLIAGAVAFGAVWALSTPPRRLSTVLLLEAAVAVPVVVSAWRWISVRYDVLNATRESVLILGTGEVAQEVCRWIAANHSGEYAVAGFADESSSRLGDVLTMRTRIQTDYETLAAYCRDRVDRVIVALDEKRGKLPVRQLMEVRLHGIEVEDATSFFERVSGKIAVETMLPSWLIFSEGFRSSALRRATKRSVDVAASLTLLVLAAPAMLLTALAVKLTSRGPVLYRQVRLGLNGREFSVLKFRSMREDAEASGPSWAAVDDPRVTPIGGIIRKLRIDELPQLINVLRGEMSFVGPRPERGHFVRQLAMKIPYYGLRMTVRPGLTGWAQVKYRYGASDEDALEKLKYDLYYIKNAGMIFDLWIILRTIRVVLGGSGAR